MNITHTGILGKTNHDIPVVSMTREDQEQINRFLDQGKTVSILCTAMLRDHVTAGPVEARECSGRNPGARNIRSRLWCSVRTWIRLGLVRGSYG